MITHLIHITVTEKNNENYNTDDSVDEKLNDSENETDQKVAMVLTIQLQKIAIHNMDLKEAMEIEIQIHIFHTIQVLTMRKCKKGKEYLREFYSIAIKL